MEFRAVLRSILEKKDRVLVVGLGISGIETAMFLSKAGLPVTIVERQVEADYRRASKFVDRLQGLIDSGVTVNFGIDGEQLNELLLGVALAVVSPGVSLEGAVCGVLRRRGIPIVSELELGIELFGWRSAVVTGSNGKSTTVSFLDEIFRAAKLPSYLCGNVGIPVVAGLSPESISVSTSPSPGVLIVEASSYQLEACMVIKPKVAVLLNISDNHLERHGSMERYLAAKARVFANQDRSDWAILNMDDRRLRALASSLPGRIAGVSLASSAVPGSAQTDGRALISYDRARGIDQIDIAIPTGDEMFDLSSTKLLGLHNRYNIAAAILAARLLGVQSEAIRTALDSFVPLEHRVEHSQSIGAPLVINDSKSTTVAATVADLRAVIESYPDRQITLLIGGLSKAGSWDPLMTILGSEKARLNPVLCFGKDGGILASHCRAAGVAHLVEPTLESAVKRGLAETNVDGILLLSPGCASFDQFTDFEERGSVFKSLVQASCPGVSWAVRS